MDIAAILSADTLAGILTFGGIGLIGACFAAYFAEVLRALRIPGKSESPAED